eukprot:5402287-Prymnesium_polylepis.1
MLTTISLASAWASAWAAATSEVTLAGTLETLAGATAVHQVPHRPHGVLFLAHGCNHRSIDFWPRSPSCT